MDTKERPLRVIKTTVIGPYGSWRQEIEVPRGKKPDEAIEDYKESLGKRYTVSHNWKDVTKQVRELEAKIEYELKMEQRKAESKQEQPKPKKEKYIQMTLDDYGL